jgi:hypothetical protein
MVGWHLLLGHVCQQKSIMQFVVLRHAAGWLGLTCAGFLATRQRRCALGGLDGLINWPVTTAMFCGCFAKHDMQFSGRHLSNAVRKVRVNSRVLVSAVL